MTTKTTTATALIENVAEMPVAKPAAAAKAPAKKAPADKAAAPAAPTTTAPATEPKATKPAIRWSYEGDRGAKGGVAQTGASPHGVYRISKDGDKWMATVERDNGKQTVLGQGVSHGAAYARCVANFKAEVAK
jgi:hypothetical protein